MKTLITPLQVCKLAFGDGETLPPETIAEADIAAAEERWIIPVIGRRFHDKLLAGAHADFCADYLASPVALCTRALIQPRLDIRTERCGTVAPKSDYAQAAGEEARRQLRRQLLSEARTLLDRAIGYLEAHRNILPEYDPDDRSATCCSIAGGIILTDHGTRAE